MNLSTDKILFFNADSGANIKAALEQFHKHLPCSAHKINSVVDDLFKIKVIKSYETNGKTLSTLCFLNLSINISI